MKWLLYFARRCLLEARISQAQSAAAYCRAQRRIAEASVAHHDANVRALNTELSELDFHYVNGWRGRIVTKGRSL